MVSRGGGLEHTGRRLALRRVLLWRNAGKLRASGGVFPQTSAKEGSFPRPRARRTGHESGSRGDARCRSQLVLNRRRVDEVTGLFRNAWRCALVTRAGVPLLLVRSVNASSRGADSCFAGDQASSPPKSTLLPLLRSAISPRAAGFLGASDRRPTAVSDTSSRPTRWSRDVPLAQIALPGKPCVRRRYCQERLVGAIW